MIVRRLKRLLHRLQCRSLDDTNILFGQPWAPEHEAQFLEDIERVAACDREVSQRRRVIASLNPDDERIRFLCDGQSRGIPSQPAFVASGWSRIMYLRYALALTEARGKVVLDLCCGMGWGTYLLGARARTSLGVDIDSAAIHAARTLFGGESTVFVRGNARAIPLPDQSVGLVTAMECVEHMTEEELTECLHEVRRILKPQGRLIGSSFFPVNEDERRGVLANPSHCLALAPSEMTRFLRGAFSWARVFHNRMFFVAQR